MKEPLLLITETLIETDLKNKIKKTVNNGLNMDSLDPTGPAFISLLPGSQLCLLGVCLEQLCQSMSDI